MKKFVQAGLDEKGTDVFFNGRFVGYTSNSSQLISELRERRRKGE